MSGITNTLLAERDILKVQCDELQQTVNTLRRGNLATAEAALRDHREMGEKLAVTVAALEAAPKWPEGNLPWHMLAGRYRAWYNSQRQAAMVAAEGE